MRFRVSTQGAARLFMLARGRGGPNESEDIQALSELLEAYATQAVAEGITVGLLKSKKLFRESTDAAGGCKILSQGDACDCFLCRVDAELKTVSSP